MTEQDGENTMGARGGRLRRIAANAALIAASVGMIFALSLGADRIVGGRLLRSPLPGAMELVFPPNSKMEFETPQFHYTSNINSLGYRDREPSSLQKDSFKIAAIGDSFTYGWGVDLEQCWVKVVERNLQQAGYNVEMINLGKPGGDPTTYAETAEKAIPVLRPDMVLVCMLQADDLAGMGGTGSASAAKPAPLPVRFAEFCWPRIVEAFRNRQGKTGPVTDSQGVHGPLALSAELNNQGQAKIAKDEYDKLPPEARVRFDALEEQVRKQFFDGTLNPCLVASAARGPNFHLDFSRSHLDPFQKDLPDLFLRDIVARAAHLMGRIKKVAGLYGAPLVGVSVPLGSYVNRAALDSYRRVGYKTVPEMTDSNVPDKAISDVFAAVGVPCLSVTDEFRKHKEDPTLFFELDGHLSAAGHALFGNLLTPLLEKELGARGKSGE